MSFKLGDRVVTPCGSVGIVEEVDAELNYATVRYRTPDDEPSCCSGCCPMEQLKDGTNVMPQPRSKEWRRKSAEFYAHVTGALKQALSEKTP